MDYQGPVTARILEELRRRRQEGADLSWTGMRRAAPTLLSAAERHFGSYRAALGQAGIEYVCRINHERWTREKIVERLRQARGAGQDLSCSKMMEQQPKLFKAARFHFGTYPSALEAAGIPPESVSRKVKIWTRDHITQTLRDLYRQGDDLRFSRMWKNCPGFTQAVLLRFGSYRKAVLSAGLPYPPLNVTQWTPPRLLQELRKRHARGDDLRFNRVRESQPFLAAAARRYFSNWRDAIVKAGIDYDLMCRKNCRADADAGRPPVRRAPILWTPQRVITELLRRRDAGQDMGPGKCDEDHASLVQACIRRFGSYRKALAAAGIELSKPPAKRWQQSEIIEGVRDLYRAGRRLSAYQASKTAGRLFSAARKRFGSWAAAVREAGVNAALMEPPGADELLREIGARHAAGADLTWPTIRKSDPLLLRSAEQHFGSYRAATEAAGLTYPDDLEPCPLSSEQTLQGILTAQSAGRDLRYRPMKTSEPRLFRSAVRHFGSYVNAVREAGINYWTMSQQQLAREREVRREQARVLAIDSESRHDQAAPQLLL